MPTHLKLFLTFARIGAFTFGGGYSMLPMFQRELIEKNGWLTEAELADYYSVSQCIPGIIAVNTAAFTGYKQSGRTGGAAAALGVVFPSIAIIIVLAAFISNFSDIPAVQNAFAGIRVCVCVLIINTVLKLWRHAVVDKPALAVFTAAYIISAFTSIPAAVLIVSSGLAGIAVSACRKEFSK